MRSRLFATLCLLAGPAFPESACDNPRDDFDGLYCLNKLYHQADKELNTNYKQLVAKLDGEGKRVLQAGQLAWIQDRNTQCSKREATRFFVDLRCATDTTIERSRFLQDRLRECSSTGCQYSKL